MSSATVNIGMGDWEASAASTLKDIFDGYGEYMGTAYDLDIKAMNDEEDRLRDQLDSGACDANSDDLRNFKKQVNDTWEDAKKYWKDFTTAYELHLGSGNVRPHAVAPIMLPVSMEAKRQVLENDVIAQLGDYEQTLSQSQIGQHWTGKGAEGYAKQIPTQVKAMSDLKKTAQSEMNTMEASSMIQRSIFLAVMTSVKRVHYTVKDMDVSNTDDRWAERIYTMRDLNKDLKEWFEEFQDGYSSSWGTMEQDLITKIKQTEGGYAELNGEGWPAATADSTGYKPNPDAGSTGPGTNTGPGTTYPNDQTPGQEYPDPDTTTDTPTGPTDGGMDTSGSGTGETGQQADEDTYE